MSLAMSDMAAFSGLAAGHMGDAVLAMTREVKFGRVGRHLRLHARRAYVWKRQAWDDAA